MNNLQKSRIIHKAFSSLIKKTSQAATHGSARAALDLMDQITFKAEILKNLGFMTNDNGKIVKFIPDKNAKIKLALQSAKGVSGTAEKLLNLLSNKK